MNFKIITFGCKLNQAESETISADLIVHGFSRIEEGTQLDFIIINSCSVTHKATRVVRQQVSRARRDFPQSRIIVTGCFTENNWTDADLWIPNLDKEKIANIICDHFNIPIKEGNNKNHGVSKERAFIKIQEGCNNFCAYCIVPFLRGLPKSRSVEEIISDIKSKEDQGIKEILLTGVNIGLYNSGEKIDLNGLLKIILESTRIERIRLGSLWPTHIDSRLIKLYSDNPRLCPHFHLSIQSGSNKILKLMGRSYTREQIIKITDKCRTQIPSINFTTDIIVGFPGETEDYFSSSKELIKKIGFSKVHIFKYSERPSTRAVDLPDQIPEKIKKERSQKLITFADRESREVKKKFINKKLPVLWEDKLGNWWYGFTDNYLRVKKPVKPKGGWKNELEDHEVKYFA